MIFEQTRTEEVTKWRVRKEFDEVVVKIGLVREHFDDRVSLVVGGVTM